MALLLDTQTLIWIEQQPEHLSAVSRERIATETPIYYSAVSVWEMAIKLKTGKLSLPLPLPDFVTKFRRGYGASYMPIELLHIYKIQELPLHHRDPVDRMLIAQSLIENVPVISSDTAWDTYGVNRIW